MIRKTRTFLFVIAALLSAGTISADVEKLPADLIVVSAKNDATKPFSATSTSDCRTNNTWLQTFHTTRTVSGQSYECLRYESPKFNLSSGVKKLVITVTHTPLDRTPNAKTDGPYFNISELFFYDGDGKEVKIPASSIKSNAPDAEGGVVANLVDRDISTHFHSSWKDAKAPAEYYHNIVVTLPESLNAFSFAMEQDWINTRLYNMPTEIIVSEYSEHTDNLDALIAQAENINVEGGDDPGFATGDYSAFYKALDDAHKVASDVSATAEQRQAAAEALKAALEQASKAEMRWPEEDKEYNLVCGFDKFFYYQNTPKALSSMEDDVLWWENADGYSHNQLFTFKRQGGNATDGYTYYIQHTATGKYIGTICEDTGADGLVWGQPSHIHLVTEPELVRLHPLGGGQFNIEVKGSSGQWSRVFLHTGYHNGGLPLGVHPTDGGGISNSRPEGIAVYGVQGPIIPYDGGIGSQSAWYIRELRGLPSTLTLEKSALGGNVYTAPTVHLNSGVIQFKIKGNVDCAFADFELRNLQGEVIPCTLKPTDGGTLVLLNNYVESFKFTFTNTEGARRVTISAPKSVYKEQLRVMTFNVPKTNIPSEGVNLWSNRVAALQKYWKTVRPDVIGMQEPKKSDLQDYLSGLPEYAMVGVGRDNGKEKGEYNPLLYNTRSIRVEDHGYFWLSTTPNTPSKSYGSQFNRMCTWALMRDKRTQALFLMCNLHLDHTSDACRESQVKVAKAQIKVVQEKLMKKLPASAFGSNGELPTILTGDFNTLASQPAYEYARGEAFPMFDAWSMSPDRNGTGYSMVASKRKLDYIFTTASVYSVAGYLELSLQPSGLQYSDHNPQYADIAWELNPVPEAEQLLQKAQAELDGTLKYSVGTTGLITNANDGDAGCQLSADAVETSEGQYFKYLIDGKTSTYLHSLYSTLPSNNPRWLQVKFNEEEERFVMSYIRRDVANGISDRWDDIFIQASNDGKTWDDITQIHAFGGEALKAYKSDVIELHKPYGYVRFNIIRTAGMRLCNGNPMYTASEFQLYGAAVSEESPRLADTEIKAQCEALEQLMAEVKNAVDGGTDTYALNAELREATEALHKALEEKGYVEGIASPAATGTASPVVATTYYHLDGTPATAFSSGVVLVRTTHADGTIRVQKRLNGQGVK